MINRIATLIMLLFCSVLTGQTMSTTPADLNEPMERSPLALKLGMSVNQWMGSEVPNARPGTGFMAGFVYAAKEANKGKLGFQTEINIRLNKYPFANERFGKSALTRISLIQAELPLLAAYALSNPTNEKYSNLLVGLAPAFTFSSRAYVGADKLPLERDNYLESWKSLPLEPMAISVAVGYQSRTSVFGFQIMLKATVNDLNRNFSIAGTLPQTGTGKPIRFLNLEAAMVF